MLFILFILVAIGIVAFWIDRDNSEEMHILTILGLVLFGLMLISFSPWQVQLVVICLSLMPKIFLSIVHHLHL